MITVVTTNAIRADCVVTATHQFRLHVSNYVRYILSFFSKEKEAASLILRAHTITLIVLCASPPHYTRSFSVPVHHHTSLSVLVYPVTLAISMCSSIKTPRQFFSARFTQLSFPTTNFSRPRVLDRHYISAPDLKGVSSLCALTSQIGSIKLLVVEIHPPQPGEIFPTTN